MTAVVKCFDNWVASVFVELWVDQVGTGFSESIVFDNAQAMSQNVYWLTLS